MSLKTDILKTNHQLKGKELDEKHFVTQMIVVSRCHPYY